jgi:hypothetical protein
MGEISAKFEKLLIDKDKSSENKDLEIVSLKISITNLETEISKLREEAAQDRLLAH